MKRCPSCDAQKEFSEFSRNRARDDGLQDYCRPCDNETGRAQYKKTKGLAQRRSHLRRAYGITLEQYDAMLLAQGELCAICRIRSAVSVDHCHETGIVRGILCRFCNAALGAFGDTAEGVMRAVAYLEGTRA